jgi:hypothetical protein
MCGASGKCALGLRCAGEAGPPFDFAQGRLCEDDRKKSKCKFGVRGVWWWF